MTGPFRLFSRQRQAERMFPAFATGLPRASRIRQSTTIPMLASALSGKKA
jgi:hypothetical protein